MTPLEELKYFQKIIVQLNDELFRYYNIHSMINGRDMSDNILDNRKKYSVVIAHVEEMLETMESDDNWLTYST